MKEYIFTFGIGQPNGGYCQPIFAENMDRARELMFKFYGDNWAFMYTREQWDKSKNDPNRMWIMEKELEPIFSKPLEVE